MKGLSRFFFVLALISFVSCSEEDNPIEVDNTSFIFFDDFESESETLDDLFLDDESRWSNVQIVSPQSGVNQIQLSDEHGSRSLEFLALPSDFIVSKAGIEKGGLVSQRGSLVTLKADFYLPEGSSYENVLLADVECCSCWDPNVPDNQCPGVRLMFDENGEFLQLERGKIGYPTLGQTEVVFPKDEWVQVELQLTLSDTEAGENRLFINGVKALDINAVNLPNQEVFETLFAEVGIDFHLTEPLGYERIQLGVTANPAGDTTRVWVDNVEIVVK